MSEQSSDIEHAEHAENTEQAEYDKNVQYN